MLGFLLGGGRSVLSLSEPHLAKAVMPGWKFRRFVHRLQRENRLRPVPFPVACDDGRLLRGLQRLAGVNRLETLVIKETYRCHVQSAEWNNVDLLDGLVRRYTALLVMRHPFDVAASTVRLCAWATGWRGRLLRLRWPAMPWFSDSTAVVRWAARNWCAYAEWMTTVGRPIQRYEDLVRDVARQMGRICGQLGVPFDPGMIDYRKPRTAFGGIGDPGVMHRPPRPVDASAIGRGASLTPAQRDIVRIACGEAASRFGYRLDDGEVTV